MIPDKSAQAFHKSEQHIQAVDDASDLLKTIDSKYSLDVLHDIQLGNQTSLTMKNFVGHLFYAFRKKGLSLYPNEDEFDLSYEQSGLYDCLGFEIEPGQTKHVKVEKKGWAIKAWGKIIPIRRAQVNRT